MGMQKYKDSRKVTWRSGSLKWALIHGYGSDLQGFQEKCVMALEAS